MIPGGAIRPDGPGRTAPLPRSVLNQSKISRLEDGQPGGVNPIDIVVTPAPTPGTTVTVQLPILNIGETGVTQARVDLSYDPTPGVITDNPDGFTDGVTGYAFPVASTATTGAIGPYMNGIAGTKTISVSFPIPATLTPGTYPIFLRIRDVVSVDPARPEAVEANNGGQALAGTITIQ